MDLREFFAWLPNVVTTSYLWQKQEGDEGGGNEEEEDSEDSEEDWGEEIINSRTSRGISD